MKRNSITYIIFKTQELTLLLNAKGYRPKDTELYFERTSRIARAAVNEIIRLEAGGD